MSNFNDELFDAFQNFGINKLKTSEQSRINGANGGTNVTIGTNCCTDGDQGCCDSDRRMAPDSRYITIDDEEDMPKPPPR